MSEPIENTTSSAKRRWRWWHIALAAFTAIILLSLLGGSPELKVTLNRNGDVQVTNIGRKVVDIKGVTVNDNSNCRVLTMLTLGSPQADPWPLRLDIGAGVTLFPACRPVRIAVDTSAGKATYEFR